jgi:hypothetical protein
MADDERRAETEAVARAMGYQPDPHSAPDDHRDRWGGGIDMAEAAVRAIDRLRDARGGDEAFMAQVQRTIENSERRMYDAMRERDEYKRTTARYATERDEARAEVARLAARSPQGEDHEAVWLWRCPECGWVGFNEDGHCRQFDEHPNGPRIPLEAAQYVPLSRVSPSRDGTVAVEDVRAKLEGIIDHNPPMWVTQMVHDALKLLAEFSPASSGDRPLSE